eukprot:TRINITY_DN13582_c0_g1_i1.p3 TRINITY_DN13582_c0_g1~~TRINITY_DN13582_c0_g1_i1.p3  ORF type:complete len:406 (+),score=96.30 TRINITY_DN13582_c0_g1_i1:79-1296(+)
MGWGKWALLAALAAAVAAALAAALRREAQAPLRPPPAAAAAAPPAPPPLPPPSAAGAAPAQCPPESVDVRAEFARCAAEASAGSGTLVDPGSRKVVFHGRKNWTGNWLLSYWLARALAAAAGYAFEGNAAVWARANPRHGAKRTRRGRGGRLSFEFRLPQRVAGSRCAPPWGRRVWRSACATCSRAAETAPSIRVPRLWDYGCDPSPYAAVPELREAMRNDTAAALRSALGGALPAPQAGDGVIYSRCSEVDALLTTLCRYGPPAWSFYSGLHPAAGFRRALLMGPAPPQGLAEVSTHPSALRFSGRCGIEVVEVPRGSPAQDFARLIAAPDLWIDFSTFGLAAALAGRGRVRSVAMMFNATPPLDSWQWPRAPVLWRSDCAGAADGGLPPGSSAEVIVSWLRSR